MTPEQALAHYRTKAAIARAAGVTPQSVQNWFNKGELPPMVAELLDLKIQAEKAKELQ